MNTCYLESAESEEAQNLVSGKTTETTNPPPKVQSSQKTARAFKSRIGEYGLRDLMPRDLCSRPAPTSFCNTQSGNVKTSRSSMAELCANLTKPFH